MCTGCGWRAGEQCSSGKVALVSDITGRTALPASLVQPGGLCVRAPNDLDDPPLLHDNHDRSGHQHGMPSRLSLTFPGAPRLREGRQHKAFRQIRGSCCAAAVLTHVVHLQRWPARRAISLSRGNMQQAPGLSTPPYPRFVSLLEASIGRMLSLHHFLLPPSDVNSNAPPAKRPHGRA